MGAAKGRAARLMASEVGVGAASDTAARMECAGGILARQFGVNQYEDNKALCMEYLMVVWHGRPQQDMTRTKNEEAVRQDRNERRRAPAQGLAIHSGASAREAGTRWRRP
jgi:hypothetical protein